ncbi:MAG: homoserine O-acetyltransferase [Saprospiraceae bacterium]|nr:homoserine O-acetyltransferase [Saprospiraceae bacterium]
MEVLKIIAPFELESGQQLEQLEIAYELYGQLNNNQDNVVWICHALTGNSDAADWWSGLVGPGKLFDPEKYLIVCANILGSCYGTTGPASINPSSGKAYGADFPLITIRDMVKAHRLLQSHLGIHKINFGIGGSMGGQQLLEWAVEQPNNFEHICVLATNAVHSPWGIAFNEAQRMAIQTGLKAGANPAEAAKLGLEAARAIAMLSYRNYDTYHQTQAEPIAEKLEDYRASSYQRYQGQKLRQRFDVYSYLALSKAMDSHNIGRGRGGIDAALKRISAATLVIGIQSDVLFPVREQVQIADSIPNAELEIINSLYGHDGFLVEFEKIRKLINQFWEGDKSAQKQIPQLKKRRMAFLRDGRLALPGTEGF